MKMLRSRPFRTRPAGKALRPLIRAGFALAIGLTALIAGLTALAIGVTALAREAAGPVPPRASLPFPVERLSASVSGHCTNPRLAPLDARLAFERLDEARHARQVVLLDLSTRLEQPLRLDSGSSSTLLAGFGQRTLAAMRDFTWTPRGPLQHLHPYALAASRDDRGSAVYLAGGTRVTAERATEGHPAWAPDGRRLAYVSSLTGEGDLYLVDLKAPVPVPVRLTFTEHAAELYPTWAPSGDRLCFVRHSERGDNLILLEVKHPARPVERPLTGWTSTQTRPSWSPTGTRLAFFSNHRDLEHFDLYVMDAVERAVPRLLIQNVLPPERHGPAWMPGGEGLLVVRDDPLRRDPLVHIDLRLGRLTVLEAGTINNLDPELGVRNGVLWLVFSAQGREGDGEERMWRRIYGGKVPRELGL